ncbi:MAG TPA: hypothetical protein VEY91_10150 [Candidatus Limnocylindria bacterium]|nr:hypothetical protein [Candidatus Limnocylindria bacterium]
MRPLATLVFLGVVALAAASPSAVSAQTLLLDYVGFDYEDPDPIPAQFGELGSGYVGVGEVPGLFAPLVSDTITFEYTYHISGLTSVSVTPAGQFIIIDYSGGLLSVYEDSRASGTPFQYAPNPPNGAVPGTFTDGTPFLIGTLSGFQIIFNTVNGTGSYEGVYSVTGGSQLGNIPVDRRTGWTFAGITSNSTQIPEGYHHQVDGQIFLNQPTPARTSSWGRIKATYR